MSKQLIFVVALTLLGTFGTFLVNPICGALVYYVLAMLRPQDLWNWAVPSDFYASYYVGCATLVAALLSAAGLLPDRRPQGASRPRFTRGHYAMFAFAIWIGVTTLLAQDFTASEKWFVDYTKIFLMFAASAVLIRTIGEVRVLMIAVALAVAYVAVDINLDYLQTHKLKIFHHGHFGYDNNGAGLVLAMAIPLLYFLFEALTSRWRWLLLLAIPPTVHAVQMTFSRGAMLALIVAVPLVVLRSRYRKWLVLALVLLGPPLVYVTAGPEIKQRFFSIESAAEVDESARARLLSWKAALKIAGEYPIFGVGVRNSNLLSQQYGADIQGRTIHSTYLQILADNGSPGLILYLFVLFTAWRGLSTVRRATRGQEDSESRLYQGMSCGIEASMFVFCFGTLFLSLEVMELPYFLMLCAVQMSLLHSTSAKLSRCTSSTYGTVPSASAILSVDRPRIFSASAEE